MLIYLLVLHMHAVRKDSDHVIICAIPGASNDAFFALSDMALPRKRGVATYMANAYDASSETNDELGSTVAGLGLVGYSPYDSGEGFVHIQNDSRRRWFCSRYS